MSLRPHVFIVGATRRVALVPTARGPPQEAGRGTERAYAIRPYECRDWSTEIGLWRNKSGAAPPHPSSL
ncbi:MAG: hypothetical protein AAFQ43_07340, partial [Bacteroidota bacterium]